MGKNRIEISSDRICQGVIKKDVEVAVEPIIYPNPFQETITIALDSSHASAVEVTIFNLTGRVVYNEKYINKKELKLNLASLSSGIHVLKLKTNETESTYKILKQ